jgi:hypothetical protein
LENDNYNNSLIINDSSLFDEMQFYSNQIMCRLQINEGFNCYEIYKMLPTLSYLGKCNTYLFKSSDNFSFDSEIQSRNGKLLIEFYRPEIPLIEYLEDPVFYIHSSDSMPSLSNNDWFKSDYFEDCSGLFHEYFFKKLEPPYNTNCKKYVNKTRADCLNDCFIKFQNYGQNCINNEQFFITFRINRNGLEPNTSFDSCDRNARKKNTPVNVKRICSNQCPVSCEQQIFIFENVLYYYEYYNSTFDFFENFYTSISYEPNMLFIEYIIKVVNIMSLWHGIDFNSIRDQIFELIKLFLAKTKIFQLFDQILQLLMSCGKFRIFAVVLMKAYRLIVGNSKV